MDEENLHRVKNTLVVILRARHHPDEVGLLLLAVRWEPRSVENNNYYDDNTLWDLDIFLPAEAYARMDHNNLSQSEEIIRLALNEITAPHRDAFISVSFRPELVEELSLSQDQLVEWIAESYNQQLTSVTN